MAAGIGVNKHQKQSWSRTKWKAPNNCAPLSGWGCRSPLNRTPSVWCPMPVSSACQMALWPGAALRGGHSLFLFLFRVLKRGWWEARFPVTLFPRNTMRTARGRHTQGVNSLEPRFQAGLHAEMFSRDRVSAVTLAGEDSRAQGTKVTCFSSRGQKLTSNTDQSLPTVHYISKPNASGL